MLLLKGTQPRMITLAVSAGRLMKGEWLALMLTVVMQLGAMGF
ncbi:hypothetical protein FBY30_3681 [Arthrobacter sp. SLBN-83]|nr:hypothetical protein FBY30_3681 [Arthrobacter sp. SLBN-83]